MMAVNRLALAWAGFLVIAACSDDSGGLEVTVLPVPTATTAATPSTEAGSPGATLGAETATGTLFDQSGDNFEDPFFDSGLHAMAWADGRNILLSADSLTAAGEGVDLLAIGPPTPAPATSGIGGNQLLVEAWVDNYSGDLVPTAFVLYTFDPTGWLATLVVDSASIETALEATTDYAAAAPAGPVSIQTTLSTFDGGTRMFRANVAVFELFDQSDVLYEGEIECTVGEALECLTLSDDGVLRPGDEGEAVEALQNDLAALGYSTGTIDGKYGPQTSAAVSGFQADYWLTVDGKAGPNTLTLMADVVAGTSDLILVSKDGIGPVPFGRPAEGAYSELFNSLGAPDANTGWYVDACDGYDWLQASWDGFTAIFTDREGFRQLDGWAINDLASVPAGVRIAGGIRLNWTWSNFDAAGAVFDIGYGGFFSMVDEEYNNGRLVDPPSDPPAASATVRGFGTGTGAFVTC